MWNVSLNSKYYIINIGTINSIKYKNQTHCLSGKDNY